MKFCKKCDCDKSLECFSKDSKTKDGLQTYCKDCKSLMLASWRASNKEHRAAYKKEYDANNKDKKALWDASYRARHKESLKERKSLYYQNNKPTHQERGRIWYRNNRGKWVAQVARYRACKINATPPWSQKELIKNVYVKAREFGGEVDHIVPLRSKTVCGLHVWANLQILPPKMNASKGNKEWPDMPEETR